MIYRIDVRAASQAEGTAAADPLGEAIRHQIEEFGTQVGSIRTSRIFLIDSDAPRQQVRKAAQELLADPVVERAELIENPPADEGHSRIEVHLKPGVMDPVAASTELALADMGVAARQVRTGRAYLIEGIIPRTELQTIASRVLANGVIESIHFEPYIPDRFSAGHQYLFKLVHVSLRELDDARLMKLSREGHLFLSLDEMKAVQDYFREQNREPTDIELETLAQTWSEHCVHKTLKSAVEVTVQDADGQPVETRRYGNLIKETIFDSTMKLMNRPRGDEFCLSVFKDNAGVVVFDELDAVCFKVETHNHPSAIEPYGGSATGVGGVIRDILGTGLGARPVANTDVFCVAYPDDRRSGLLPKGVIHPRRILRQIVAGVRDYGNRMGIPTLNGAVYFDNRYIGNPLVFCGCVGMIPRDKIAKEARRGDAIVVMGGRTGRDGIHGATFSSAELTDTHADEFSHAVQIGNAITEKKMADVIMEARDQGLFSAITDCGAGGLSSAVGEMGEKIGAVVHLEQVPLKYQGLRYDEIWISEAQERMVLAVPADCVEPLLNLSRSEDVEATVIGQFGTPGEELILQYNSHEVGRLAMKFLHDGIPMPTRKAIVRRHGAPDEPSIASQSADASANVTGRLISILKHPNVASKHWIIRQYDHEVQGGSVIKPLIGRHQIGPADAAVIQPKLGSHRGVAVACGMAPHIGDPYRMAIASIDEAVRNIVCVGADLGKIAVLDNFCWPSVDDETTMGALVAACEACRDAALAFGIPFISGKDSLHNQFTDQETGRVIRIPNTLLISAMAVLDDVRQCVTMDLKETGDDRLLLIEPAGTGLSDYLAVHRAISQAIGKGQVLACHDVSEGGYLTAVAEMAIASGLGARLDDAPPAALFAEGNARYVVQATRDVEAQLRSSGVLVRPIGRLDAKSNHLLIGPEKIGVDELTRAWRGTLDW
ncbi:MAG: phosphoribosylformylglycinamidine synthase subunit PurS [Phycisphaerales bacterium]|nr:phosphoribosylformylglycinamidine synthase subunit PurS [Phycisphaerales bacterium]